MKKALRYILIFAAIFALCQTTALAAKSLSQLQNEKSDLAERKAELQEALKDVREKQQEIAAEIVELDIKFTEAQNALDEVKAKLTDAEARLAQAEAELADATFKKDAQMELFKKRIKFIYENGEVGYFDVILNADNVTDLLTRMQYVNDIMEYDKATLAELQRIQNVIQTKTQEISDEKAGIEVMVAEQQTRADEVEGLLSQKQAAAAKYEADEESYKQSIKEAEAASAEVERLIKAASSPKTSPSGQTITYSGGQLEWPVPGRSYISSGYGNRKGVFVSGTEFHTGIDIPAAYGSNILAAEAGTVITSRYVSGYGYTIILDHGSGLTTLYGHNSKLLVSVGDYVTRGQAVALAGSTGNSTGTHCHFEVRVNGKHTDPCPYLGI